ncbi:hypothetical protein [Spiroplasma turonicum]|uniref:Lipoprotein n=1 Tax=Spiroplasma turonicum TaxID=216946 RepID=A0A0K1P7C4_9MOLU|nr:hypothetical protein [Spiroplasma turonicum]AKU80206.1 hypothetical protein STURON_00960 [Spiroplasma turonicum]ALX71206.1 hypothetical protein STURO_v1c09550 [Spiroplasma turonicum]
MKKFLLPLLSLPISSSTIGFAISCNSTNKVNLSTLEYTDIGDIYGVEELPTIKTIIKKYFENINKSLFSLLDVKFVGEPSKVQATIEASDDSNLVYGTVTFNYNYTVKKPYFTESVHRQEIEVGKKSSFAVKVGNGDDITSIDCEINDERDKKTIKINSIEKMEYDNNIFLVRYEAIGYLAKNKDSEKFNYISNILVKYKNAEMNVEINCMRINLGNVEYAGALNATWEESEENNPETLSKVLVQWNIKNPDVFLTENDVELYNDYSNNKTIHILKSTYNLNSKYMGDVLVRFNYPNDK